MTGNLGRRFDERVVAITGGAQGIGLATAMRCGREGGRIAILDMAEGPAHAALESLRAVGIDAHPFLADLRSAGAATAAVDAVVTHFGRIDVLVNNAGGTVSIKPYAKYSPEEIANEIDRSLMTAMYGSRAAIPHMIRRGSGSIVNVGSNSPRGIYRVPYAAAKGGVFALTTALSLEVAALGIRVNCVAPGATRVEERPTPRRNVDALTNQDRQWQRQLEEFLDAQIPMKRWGTVDEQAAAIAFMASDDASFITGQILSVAGGSTVP